MQNLVNSILVVEDEEQIRRFIVSTLEQAGFAAHVAENGRRGLIEAGTRQPNVLILDLGLPDMDGIEVIQAIRAWSAVPIVALSARTLEAEKVRALDAGADDFISKPFGSSELIARIKAQLRRNARNSANNNEGIFEFGEIKVDLPRHKVWRQQEPVQLTPIEFRLLTVLISNAGCVITQRQLLKEVWGPSHIESGHYVRIYMGHLRQKLEVDPAQPQYLITETGVGYRLSVD